MFRRRTQGKPGGAGTTCRSFINSIHDPSKIFSPRIVQKIPKDHIFTKRQPCSISFWKLSNAMLPKLTAMAVKDGWAGWWVSWLTWLIGAMAAVMEHHRGCQGFPWLCSSAHRAALEGEARKAYGQRYQALRLPKTFHSAQQTGRMQQKAALGHWLPTAKAAQLGKRSSHLQEKRKASTTAVPMSFLLFFHVCDQGI